MMDLPQNLRTEERRLWSGYLRRRLDELGLGGRTAAPEVAESLAVFCQQREGLPPDALPLLMARSFCGSGDAEAAGRVLRRDPERRRCAEQWLDALSADWCFPEILPLFSAQVLRPQKLTAAGPLWLLDLNGVRLAESDRHELTVYRTLRRLTEQISPLWSRTGGAGTLGVKGLRRFAALLREPRSGRLPALLEYIREVLAGRARRNGWPATPSVLRMDV